MADDRFGGRPPRGDRPPFERPRFTRPGGPPPAPAGPPSGPPASVRLRDGEREIEVSGSAPFVRQVIDDMRSLMAQLRGDAPAKPQSISMPPVPAEAPAPEPKASNGKTSEADLEKEILRVIRDSRKGLAVAAIRKQLGDDVTAQQVRRALERSTKVVASKTKPVTYRLSR